jgi:hypothetical protein
VEKIFNVMELQLERDIRTPKSTTGKLAVDERFECFILEDVDRGLTQSMPLKEIQEKKVYGKTAIPSGRYKVILTWSNRFKRTLPLLVNVPGYDGIRMHPGNSDVDTLGCLLPGVTRTKDFVSSSRVAFDKLFTKLKAADDKGEDIYITIK